MDFRRSRPLSVIREMSHPARHNRRSYNEDVENHEDQAEMQPMNPRPEVHVEPAGNETASKEMADQPLPPVPPKVPKGIFFMLFNWISPVMDELRDNRKKYQGSKNLDKLENFLDEKITECLPKEKAKKNHDEWDKINAKTPCGKLFSFIWLRLFLATIFHVVTIVSSFLTLVSSYFW